MDIIVPSEGLSYEEITVSNAVIGFTPALLIAFPQPKGAVLTLETAAIRWRVDGGDPSGTVGHLMSVGDSIVIHGPNNMPNFKAFRDTAVDGVLRVSYILT